MVPSLMSLHYLTREYLNAVLALWTHRKMEPTIIYPFERLNPR